MKKIDKDGIRFIYNELCKNHTGSENGISRDDFCAEHGINTRDFRRATRDINVNPEYEKIVSSKNKIYICNTKEECRESIKCTYSMAFSLLRKARIMEKRCGVHNQMYIGDDGDVYVRELFDEDETK